LLHTKLPRQLFIPLCFQQNIKYSEAAAIEYAICHLNIRNIIICAHTECGAIKASIKHADSHDASGLDNWLQIIKEGFKKHAPSDPTEGTKLNLLNQIEHLKTYPLVEDLLAKNEITISAWVYDVHSAQILEWDTSQQDFRYILAQSNDSN
jgi:carbonic anhydrase